MPNLVRSCIVKVLVNYFGRDLIVHFTIPGLKGGEIYDVSFASCVVLTFKVRSNGSSRF